jgi:gas vesicle protein
MSNQNNENNINAKDFIIGTFVGGIVGAATALLLAPKSGKELRTNLNDQAIVLKDKSGELASKAKDTSQSLAKNIQLQSSQVTNKVRDISDKFRQERAEDSVDVELEEQATDDLVEETVESMTPSFEDHITTSDVETANKE